MTETEMFKAFMLGNYELFPTGLSPVSFLSLSGMKNNGTPLHPLPDLCLVIIVSEYSQKRDTKLSDLQNPSQHVSKDLTFFPAQHHIYEGVTQLASVQRLLIYNSVTGIRIVPPISML